MSQITDDKVMAYENLFFLERRIRKREDENSNNPNNNKRRKRNNGLDDDDGDEGYFSDYDYRNEESKKKLTL